MTLIFMEGFEHKQVGGSSTYTYTGTPAEFVPGRMGGFALGQGLSQYWGQTGYLTIPIPAEANPTYVVSAAVKIPWGDGLEIFGFLDSGGTRHNASLTVAAGSRQVGVAGVNGTYIFPLDEWVRVDLKVTFGASANIAAWVNGVKVAERVGYSSLPYPGALLGKIVMNTAAGASRAILDDVYVLNGVGPAPYNDRLGDVRVETLVPAADAAAGFTPFGVANNWQAVGELPPDGETAYNIGDVDGERDLFDMSALDAGGGILAVQQHFQARKTESGETYLKPVMKDGASVRVDSQLGLSTTHGYIAGPIHTTHPSGDAWAPATVTSTEFGYEAEIS